MEYKQRWGFGFGTIFSLIVVYFIYLYSKDKGWALLTFLSKWYLIIVGGLLALSLGIILLVLLFSLFILLIALFKMRKLKKAHKKQQKKEYLDAEFEIKE